MIISLLDFHKKINAELINKIETQNVDNQQVLQLMSHIIAAHKIWNDRILKRPISISPFSQIPMSEWVVKDITNHSDTLQIVESNFLDTMVSYTNTKNESFENSIGDILLHIVNHATYHRGQIAMLLRMNGFEPISSDYITYKRENF